MCLQILTPGTTQLVVICPNSHKKLTQRGGKGKKERRKEREQRLLKGEGLEAFRGQERLEGRELCVPGEQSRRV